MRLSRACSCFKGVVRSARSARPLPLFSSCLDAYRTSTHPAAQELREANDAADKLRLQMVDLKTRLGADAVAGGTTGGDKSLDDGRHTPLRPSKERDALNPELAAFLRKV